MIAHWLVLAIFELIEVAERAIEGRKRGRERRDWTREAVRPLIARRQAGHRGNDAELDAVIQAVYDRRKDIRRIPGAGAVQIEKIDIPKPEVP